MAFAKRSASGGFSSTQEALHLVAFMYAAVIILRSGAKKTPASMSLLDDLPKRGVVCKKASKTN